MNIKKVCVIGSGVMGSGIAAQVANAGIEVILLDLVGKGDKALSELAKEKIIAGNALAHHSYANNIHCKNLETDLKYISECDLIIEVIIEKLEIKHDLYEKITPYLKKGAIIASNTSTLPRKELCKNLNDELKKSFYITHFFNPPRFMPLLELVSDDKCDKQQKNQLENFLYEKLGKTIINCYDTPGFVANRIGCFFLESAVREALKLELNPYIVDHLANKYFGLPKTGIFGLYDLIGHDVMNLISLSLTQALSQGDEYNKIKLENKILSALKDKGAIGRKSGAGFYKMVKEGSSKNLNYYDFKTLEYKHAQDLNNHILSIIDSSKDIASFLNCNNNYSKFFSNIFSKLINYCAITEKTIVKNKGDIDKAMQLGYSFKYGPFEIEKLMQNEDHSNKILKSYNIEIQDEIVIFTIGTKMGILTAEIFNGIQYALNLAQKNKQPLIINSSAKIFSAGADLKFIKNSSKLEVEKFIKLGQQVMLNIKYSSIPVIAAAHGTALGGGTELLLHAHAIIAEQNLTAGLVEASIGLLPAFAGTTTLLVESASNEAKLRNAISNIVEGKKCNSAEYFSESYSKKLSIINQPDMLLSKAIDIAKSLNFTPLKKLDKISFINLKFDTDNDLKLFLQKIINSSFNNEDEILKLEREKFLELANKL